MFSRKFSYRLRSSLVIASKLPSSNQIVFSNFNLKIYYPPPYERLIGKYEKANARLIKRAKKRFRLRETFSYWY